MPVSVSVYLFGLTIVLFLVSNGASAQSATKFMGREVTITEPEHDADGFMPKGSASICIEGPPQRQCCKAAELYGHNATAGVIRIEKGMPALFFSALSRGTSGSAIHFALLRPGSGDRLDNFLPDTSVSNQSEYAFWNDASISGSSIFVTADWTLGPDESHYSPHRYIISAYALRASPSLLDGLITTWRIDT